MKRKAVYVLFLVLFAYPVSNFVDHLVDWFLSSNAMIDSKSMTHSNRFVLKEDFTTKDSDKEVFSDSSNTSQNVTNGNILYASAKGVLDFKIPKYMTGYRNPCFKIRRTGNGYQIVESQQESNQTLFTACLPSFIVAGIRKSGTSELFARMTQHPQIYHSMKETHFFDYNPHSFRALRHVTGSYTLMKCLMLNKMTSLSRLQGHDEWVKAALLGQNDSMLSDPPPSSTRHPYGKDVLLGDFTPAYGTRCKDCSFKDRDLATPARAFFHLNPDLKVIFLLREPAERAWSSIRYSIANNQKLFEGFLSNKNLTTVSVEMIEKTIDLWTRCLTSHSATSCAFVHNLEPNKSTIAAKQFLGVFTESIRNSIYHIYIEEYLKYFPKEHILAIRAEDLSTNYLQVLNDDVFPFLDLKPLQSLNDRGTLTFWNTNTRVTDELPTHLRNRLREFYKPYNKKLVKLLNDNHKFYWGGSD